MARELPKVYDPREVESSIYQMWEDHKYFHAEKDESKKKDRSFLVEKVMASTERDEFHLQLSYR